MSSLDFWQRLDHLLRAGKVVIDRPAGSRHPRYRDIVYPLDYGHLEGVLGGDGNPIDVWVGACDDRDLVGIVCSVDTMKRHGEYKLLLGCTETEAARIQAFDTNEYMSCVVLHRAYTVID